jgi:hypothetical protein
MGTFRVTDDDGIITVAPEARVVDRPLAEALCREIEAAASRRGGRARVLMNLSALSRATPRAALYAMRRLKGLDPEAIALFKGNLLMRALARGVLGAARFHDFALFPDEASARAWLAAHPEKPAT